DACGGHVPASRPIAPAVARACRPAPAPPGSIGLDPVPCPSVYQRIVTGDNTDRFESYVNNRAVYFELGGGILYFISMADGKIYKGMPLKEFNEGLKYKMNVLRWIGYSRQTLHERRAAIGQMVIDEYFTFKEWEEENQQAEQFASEKHLTP
ncbi:MAG: hypothetical protein V2I43_24460, partial [Parvularcula sp.]|nr:hypothetical protein [Parvularcula sp.]